MFRLSLPFAYGSPMPMTDSPLPPLAPVRRKWNLPLILALLALGGTGWQWVESRQAQESAQQLVASKIAEANQATLAARTALARAEKATQDTAARLAQLEAHVNEASGQYATLASLHQDVTRNQEDWLQAEIEHTLNLATQQLILAGNVPATINALEQIDARLTKLDKPQYIALRRALGSDLDALKALPRVDVVGVTARLERLAAGIDTLPLEIDHQPNTPADKTTDKAAPLPADAPAWQAFAYKLLHEASKLVRIRNMDKPEALLLSPEQAFFLRENVKLRLLDARLALMQRDGASFHSDVDAIAGMIQRHFDGNAAATQRWLTTLDEIKREPVANALPELTASFKAVRQLATAGVTRQKEQAQ